MNNNIIHFRGPQKENEGIHGNVHSYCDDGSTVSREDCIFGGRSAASIQNIIVVFYCRMTFIPMILLLLQTFLLHSNSIFKNVFLFYFWSNRRLEQNALKKQGITTGGGDQGHGVVYGDPGHGGYQRSIIESPMDWVFTEQPPYTVSPIPM